jgi:hypothetical protein
MGKDSHKNKMKKMNTLDLSFVIIDKFVLLEKHVVECN